MPPKEGSPAGDGSADPQGARTGETRAQTGCGSVGGDPGNPGVQAWPQAPFSQEALGQAPREPGCGRFRHTPGVCPTKLGSHVALSQLLARACTPLTAQGKGWTPHRQMHTYPPTPTHTYTRTPPTHTPTLAHTHTHTHLLTHTQIPHNAHTHPYTHLTQDTLSQTSRATHTHPTCMHTYTRLHTSHSNTYIHTFALTCTLTCSHTCAPSHTSTDTHPHSRAHTVGGEATTASPEEWRGGSQVGRAGAPRPPAPPQPWLHRPAPPGGVPAPQPPPGCVASHPPCRGPGSVCGLPRAPRPSGQGPELCPALRPGSCPQS